MYFNLTRSHFNNLRLQPLVYRIFGIYPHSSCELPFLNIELLNITEMREVLFGWEPKLALSLPLPFSLLGHPNQMLRFDGIGKRH